MLLILCGFCCAGKTTLGRKAAGRLKLPFIDTDILIERENPGKTVSQLWEERGQEWFRSQESRVVLSLKKEPAIVALGGGAPLLDINREHLRPLGLSIYLKHSTPGLYRRILKRGRLPAFLDKNRPLEHFETIVSARSPIYEAFSQLTIECEDKSEEEITRQITEAYGRQ